MTTTHQEGLEITAHWLFQTCHEDFLHISKSSPSIFLSHFLRLFLDFFNKFVDGSWTLPSIFLLCIFKRRLWVIFYTFLLELFKVFLNKFRVPYFFRKTIQEYQQGFQDDNWKRKESLQYIIQRFLRRFFHILHRGFL